MKAEFILSDNEKLVNAIRKGLDKKEAKYGFRYCPCVTKVEHSEKTICPCEVYSNTGDCHCGMYIK